MNWFSETGPRSALGKGPFPSSAGQLSELSHPRHELTVQGSNVLRSAELMKINLEKTKVNLSKSNSKSSFSHILIKKKSLGSFDL